MKNVSRLFVAPETPLNEVILCINKNRSGIALVVDDNQHLLGVITDGDIRRTIIQELELTIPAQNILSLKEVQKEPVTANKTASPEDIRELFRETNLSHIPLVDDDKKVVGLVALDDLLSERLPIQAMVLAGGAGRRLQPLTNNLPKPMLPLGERPLLEHIINQLTEVGIHRVNVATHYLADKIVDYFGDGRDFGVELNYVSEDRPLGTAGALGLMGTVEEPLLVINGDILSNIDYRSMLAHHQKYSADLTMGVRQYDQEIPYGVVESDGVRVKRLREKPQTSYFINAGIYLLQPSVYQFINNGEHLDMTDLIQRLLDAGRSIVSYPIMEYWQDIGQIADYERAQEDMKKGRV